MNLKPVTTVELKRNDRVLLFNGLVRTVDEIGSTGYVNNHDEPIYAVRYQEGDSDEWSGVNTSNASGVWRKLTESS